MTVIILTHGEALITFVVTFVAGIVVGTAVPDALDWLWQRWGPKPGRA